MTSDASNQITSGSDSIAGNRSAYLLTIVSMLKSSFDTTESLAQRNLKQPEFKSNIGVF